MNARTTYLHSPPSTSGRPQPLFGRPQSATRHSYAGSSFTSGHGSWATPMGSSSPLSVHKGTDDDMGEITDEDFHPMVLDNGPDEGDEEDLFFGSSSFKRRSKGDEGNNSFDDSFGWGSAPETSFAISIIASTPSPRSKNMFGGVPSVPKLEKKYKPRDSGIVMSEDEDSGLSALRKNGGRGFGRSGSMLEAVMPSASTSVSTIASSDQELITPGFFPSAQSGWPLGPPGIVSSSDSEGAMSLAGMRVESDVDAFIVRTLLQAQQTEQPLKRPPGTPQKRMKTAGGFGFGQRPWQSAVASKVGFDFGDHEATKRKEVKKGKPRKSLPAAFPILGTSRKSKKGKVEESTDEEDGSPSTKYEGLGLGRPSVGKAGVGSWLLRRSSSGAISVVSAGSASGEGSLPGTPTAGKGSGE